MRHYFWVICYLTGWMSLSAQNFTGTNAPGAGSNFTVTLGAGATNLSLILPGASTNYSYVFVRKDGAPTESSYDFSSQVSGRTNEIYLERPEVSAGTYHVRVSTPAGSLAHSFSLTVQTNQPGLRAAARPVTKPLNGLANGLIGAGLNEFFRVELVTNTMWRVALDTTNNVAPDLYVARGQVPTTASYLQRSVNATNDLLALTGSDGSPGVYYVGVFGAGAPAGGVNYDLQISPIVPVVLDWDPGTTHLGTLVQTNTSGVAGDYYFRITMQNPSLGAWRTALRVLNAYDANVYLKRGLLPTPATADFKSERSGSDGMVLAMPRQFQPGEDWYLLVRAKAGSQWTLVSGTPFVTDLGLVAADASSGSGEVEVGAEGMRFFSATVSADMLAWRLWLNGLTNSILIKKTSLPVAAVNELSQSGQMLVVPSYLTVGQYFIGVSGNPGSVINLDSRQQAVVDVNYGQSVTNTVTGFGYTTYRVQVPAQQIAWQMNLPSTNGDPNMAVRRNTVPNENNNDAYSELVGNLTDNIMLVPPVLSDGTFYITVYSTNGTYQYTFNNGLATVTDINYITVITNDAPATVGWRYYRVADISQQLGSLGWDLFLTNFAPGTRIALRKNAAPSLWTYRTPSPGSASYYDVLSTADYLQRPAHQADVWYVGVYNPTNALGPFVLTTRELPSTPLVDNVPMVRSNVLSGRWEFFRVQITPEDMLQTNGHAALLGWDLRLTNVTSGLPRVVVRREGLPKDLNGTISVTATNWASGAQWAAGADWTKRTFGVDGTNEDGRILAMAAGRPLEPGTYYIGVINSTGTNAMSYSVLSRWIGTDRVIPVADLSWNGGVATNTVGPREAVYYRVMVPPNAPSWKVRLTPLTGEAMMVVTTSWVPRVDSEKRVQKTAKEQYVMLPKPGEVILFPGTNYIAVVGEGVSPGSSTSIGAGVSTFVLESLGAMPEIELGLLAGSDLVTNGTLEGGASIAYHFDRSPGALGFWVTLENSVGDPWMAGRFGGELVAPGLNTDTYGNEGGETQGVLDSPYLLIGAGSSTNQVTVMVKARKGADDYPDASYTLRIEDIVPQPMNFDGGVYQIVNRPAERESFFVIDVPPGALGWDVRLTDVVSGSPQILIARDILPIFETTSGFTPNATQPWLCSTWASGASWAVGLDWTGRKNSPVGVSESGQILAMGMGRPLQPGRYYVGVVSTDGQPVNCAVLSRGIGDGLSIPVTPLAFAGGQVSVTNLPAREAAYFQVTIPTNMPSWKVQLTATNGESLVLALKDVLPNVGAAYNASVTNSGGRKMQKTADEQFLLLPPAGQGFLTGGTYYLAVVSEGQWATNQNQIGSGSSSFVLTSQGVAPVTDLGEVGADELLETNTLAGGETRIYHFSVPVGIDTLEVRLENRVGNPTMALVAGALAPYPGAANSPIQPDYYGNEGGEAPGTYVATNLLTVANPTNGVYTLVVKARPTSSTSTPDAAYTLRLTASGTIPVAFDQGLATVNGQPPSTWRYFWVQVPTNAGGWDVRLINVTNGTPKMVVCRESLPATLATTGWSSPGKQSNWPTNAQWAPTYDWTHRSLSVDGVSEDGRILAMGMNQPLQPGTYYIGVLNTSPTNASYKVYSRGIGTGFSIPIVDLPFVGSQTNSFLAARDAAYYRVIVPSNAPSWKVRLAAINGECMLSGLRGALPNVDTSATTGTGFQAGKAMQKLGNEHYLMLPITGPSNIPAGTNYLAVISEGVNPGAGGNIGPGGTSYVIASLGAMPVPDLGLLTSEDLVCPDAIEGGAVKAYQFSVPPFTYGVKVRLENRVNNPSVVALAGNRMPAPGAAVTGLPADTYGGEGGYTPTDGHATIVTLPNTPIGTYRLAVKARSVAGNYPDASYTLRVQEILVPQLNFSSSENTNGISNEVSGLLEDNERAFFKFLIPTNSDGQPVIGWKLELVQSSGLASMRVRKGELPSDANSTSTQMTFTTAAAIIAPPYLTNGEWFVEVKATGSTAFTLRSSPLPLARPAWVMPAPDATNTTPGLSLPMFGDTGIETNGLPLPGDQSLFLEQGALHYYAVVVPENNRGLLRAQLEAISGNPDLYLRAEAVPTLYHNLTGGTGTIYDRSMLASSGTEYANWVPLDGKTETQLEPGLWYLAVRAAGNANARYRLRLSVGNVVELPIHGNDLTNQIVAGGDWLYYRLDMPEELPLSFNVTFSQQSGSVTLYLRDTVPPGNGITGSTSDQKDWAKDAKNFGPYPNFSAPGTYTFDTPPVRPGQPLYLGFRATGDSTFTVRVNTNGAPAQLPAVLPFYGGTATTNIPAYSSVLFRVDVPPEAVRWQHFSTHATNIVVYLDQGTVPTRTGTRWTGSVANSSYSKPLVTWNASLRQYVPATWPWVAGQSYYLMATNVTGISQTFSITMDGRNAATDDSDADLLPDAWELFYFGNLSQTAVADPDKDGISNQDESLEGTDPSDGTSYRARLVVSAVGGSISAQPDLPSYALGSTVTLTAIPVPGYAFVSWGGQASGQSNPLPLLMDGHKSVFAVFKLAGDDFHTALPLSGTAVVTTGSNVGMSKEPGEPFHAGNPGGKSIWWRWTAPASGSATLSTAGSSFATLLAVYTGPTVSNLTAIASDYNSLGGTNRSRVTFNAVAGTTYQIAVDGYNGASSYITLSLSAAGTVVRPELGEFTRGADGAVQFKITGDANQAYVVEYSADLKSWETLGTATNSAGGTAIYLDPGTVGVDKRFYRVRLQ